MAQGGVGRVAQLVGRLMDSSPSQHQGKEAPAATVSKNSIGDDLTGDSSQDLAPQLSPCMLGEEIPTGTVKNQITNWEKKLAGGYG